MAKGATKTTKTGFDKFVDEQMGSPSFAKAYAEARADVDAVDRIVRDLDEARQQRDMTKAELARAAGLRPEIVRRLFTADEPNPTLETVVRVMAAVGCTLAVVPLPPAKVRATRGHASTLRGARARYSSPRRRTSA